MPCNPKRAVSAMICCMSVDMRRLPLGQSPHKAPVIPKRMYGSIGSRDLVASPAAHAFESPSILAAIVAPEYANAEETNSRLLRPCEEMFLDKVFSFDLSLSGLEPEGIDMGVMAYDKDFSQ